ncbi:TonB-dependent receptor domain-containing protein [Brevundimonas sp. M20]|uniref:TonB-dependent receptor domain-containing protein n=1 Tax=Brevundimonas sp. M20 TaxID=2591463 RepID=UPI001F10A80E|nr:TonB-dependent receptor [Brevundimonas sp. M20]
MTDGTGGGFCAAARLAEPFRYSFEAQTMKTVKMTLGGLLLATTALVAPGVALAQTAPTAQSAAQQAEPQVEQDVDLGEVVVLGRYIPQPNRESPEVAAFLTAEDLERTGDADAAQALSRVTGLSIVEGRFIYVRGLGERYSSALLNGSPLPSPEPLQRVVPLDLFPSEVLSGLTVQKTYSAAFPGEFGGGVVDLQTIDTPVDPFFSMSASLSGNTETSNKDGLIYYGSRTDFTSFDDGTRDVPGQLQLGFNSGQRISAGNFTADELRLMGQSLVNAPLRLLQRETTPANFGVRFMGGASSETGMGTLGGIFVASYDNKWTGRRGDRQSGRIDAGELVTANDFDFESNQNDLTLNFLGAVSLTSDTNTLKWTNLFVRNVSKEARSEAGFDDASGGQRRTDHTEWFVRQLFSTQLAGEHTFGSAGEWEFDWRAAYALTSRDAPYESRFGYGQNVAGDWIHDIETNAISFSELEDDIISGGADVHYTLPLSDAREAVFSFGVAYSDNNRESEQRTLRFIAPNGLTQDQLESRVDYLFSDANIGPYLQIEEITGTNGAAAFDGQMTVKAAYAQVAAEFLPLLNLNLGVRFEQGEQTVTPRDLFGGSTGFLPTEIKEEYVLPAGTITWNFAEDMQLRLGASKTIGRPQFRELAPQQYTDVESDRTFIGNPYLVDTEILNVDARWEWYFARQQYVTAGLFYKDLDKPIESSVIDQGSSISQTFLNAPNATIMGAELEVKKYFEFGSGMDFIANKRWLAQANYTWSDSEVNVDAGDTVITQNSLGVAQPASFYVVDGSRLQGQSEHVVNVQLGWEDDTARSQATLIANYVSERTSARGRPGEPDLIQEPGVQLDFVFRKDFDYAGREYGVSFELRNLLGEEFLEYQELGNRVIINGYELGTSGSISLTARF